MIHREGIRTTFLLRDLFYREPEDMGVWEFNKSLSPDPPVVYGW